MCIFHLKIRSFCHKWFIWKLYYSWQRNRNRSFLVFLLRFKKKPVLRSYIHSLMHVLERTAPPFYPTSAQPGWEMGSAVSGTIEQPSSLYTKQVSGHTVLLSSIPTFQMLGPPASNFTKWHSPGSRTCSTLASILAIPPPYLGKGSTAGLDWPCMPGPLPTHLQGHPGKVAHPLWASVISGVKGEVHWLSMGLCSAHDLACGL